MNRIGNADAISAYTDQRADWVARAPSNGALKAAVATTREGIAAAFTDRPRVAAKVRAN